MKTHNNMHVKKSPKRVKINCMLLMEVSTKKNRLADDFTLAKIEIMK